MYVSFHSRVGFELFIHDWDMYTNSYVNKATCVIKRKDKWAANLDSLYGRERMNIHKFCLSSTLHVFMDDIATYVISFVIFIPMVRDRFLLFFCGQWFINFNILSRESMSCPPNCHYMLRFMDGPCMCIFTTLHIKWFLPGGARDRRINQEDEDILIPNVMKSAHNIARSKRL